MHDESTSVTAETVSARDIRRGDVVWASDEATLSLSVPALRRASVPEGCWTILVCKQHGVPYCPDCDSAEWAWDRVKVVPAAHAVDLEGTLTLWMMAMLTEEVLDRG
jgi:hypothetical protein